MSNLNPARTGFTFAILFGGWHLCWSVLVAAGAAQAVADFVFWMHFIKPVYVIQPFDLERAAILLVVTTCLGFLIGWAFARIWNASRSQL